MSAVYQFDGDKIDWTQIDDPTQDYPLSTPETGPSSRRSTRT